MTQILIRGWWISSYLSVANPCGAFASAVPLTTRRLLAIADVADLLHPVAAIGCHCVGT